MDVVRDPSHKRKRQHLEDRLDRAGAGRSRRDHGGRNPSSSSRADRRVERDLARDGEARSDDSPGAWQWDAHAHRSSVSFPARNDGRVDKIFIRPGTPVKADSVLMKLSNPELENEAVDSEYALKQEEAGLYQSAGSIAEPGFR